MVYKAYESADTEGLVCTEIDIAAALPAGYWRGPKDSARLFKAQRAYKYPSLGGRLGAGGRGVVTIITRKGVTKTTVIDWRDKIGVLTGG